LIAGEIFLTIFSDLNAQYASCRRSGVDYRRASIHFINRFASAFRQHIGAPEHYANPETGRSEPVQVLSCQKNKDGDYTFKRMCSPFDVIELQEDGRWLTALGLVLGAENYFPKGEIAFPIEFILHEQNCTMILGSKNKHKFELSLEDEKTFKPVFDCMVGFVKEFLAKKPWDRNDTIEQRQIGFLPLA
jgi:hypothetical protein